MMRSDLAVYLVVGVLLILLILPPRWLWRHGKVAQFLTVCRRSK
jgi:hypothetical protein